MGCPDANALTAMVHQTVDPVAFQQLEVHIDSCEACRKAVAVLALGSQPTVTPATAEPWAKRDAVASDRYAIASVLGTGGMGRILSAFDRQLGRKVALKELREQRPDLEARFRREALLTARLEHPNIVSLHEAGTWPSGEPFYTMRLVSGRPLSRVLAEAKTYAERIALLPHVIAVADALAYAHQEGIVHRDLKPQNVMVGEFGETVVIDWGLAKDLAAGSEPPLAASEVTESTETRAGEILGTPSYMPPEQACGESVDARADVYAIGAILYHLLAGEPPYGMRTGREVLEAVLDGPPAPLDDNAIPRDLIAIIERAMAREPAARYATARELREDLRRFHNGQLVGAHHYTVGQLVRRWLARHRTTVAVGLAGLVFLAVVAVISVQRIVREQRHAEAQRELAEQHRAQAEGLMHFMLFDLKQKLEPTGKVDLLAAVAAKAAAYYEQQPVSNDERQRAAMHHSLGDVLKSQGDMPAALAQYRTAVTIRSNVVSRAINDAGTLHELVSVRLAVGDVLRAQGDTVAALAEYRGVLALGESKLARSDVATAHDKIGRALLAQGDQEASLASHRRALELRKSQAASDPSDLVLQRNLAVSHSNVGDALFAKQDLAGALAEYRAGLAIRDMLLAKDPSNASIRRDLSVSHDNIGDVLRAQNDSAGALVEFRFALIVSEQLAAQDPTNAGWQRDHAVARAKFGQELRAQGNAKAALAEYREGLAIASRLAAKDPTNAEWQRDVIIMREYIGDAHLALRDPAAALAEFRAILPIKEKLAAQDPTNVGLQRDVSVTHAALGDALRAQGNAKAALVEYRIDLALTEKLLAQDPSNFAWRYDLAVSHRNVGYAFEAMRNANEARDAFRKALGIIEQLLKEDPPNPQLQQDVANLRKLAG